MKALNIKLLILLFLLAAGSVVSVLVFFNTREGNEYEKENMEITEEWTVYKNEQFGFSFFYPKTMYLEKRNGLNGNEIIAIHALSPDDPQRVSSIGLASVFTVKIIEKDEIDKHIKEIKENEFTQNFSTDKLSVNDTVIPLISYVDAYGAGFYSGFMEIKNDKAVQISFASDTAYSSIFLEILKTFK